MRRPRSSGGSLTRSLRRSACWRPPWTTRNGLLPTGRSRCRRRRSLLIARATSIWPPGFGSNRRWRGFFAAAPMCRKARRRFRKSGPRTSPARRAKNRVEERAMRVTDAIGHWFAERGFQHYFGYAGAAALPLLDGLAGHPEIVGIQPKHESHAVHMADVYYRVTGRLAPVVVTKGPGVANCIGGMATALHDTSAVMLIAGGGPTHHLGKSMQEFSYHGFEDVVNLFRPVTKRAWMQVRPDTVIDTLNQAFKTAVTGRPGPVFVYIPLDILYAEVEGQVTAPRALTSRVRADSASIDQVADMIRRAERPLVIAGGGAAFSAGAPESLKSFV